MGVNEAVKDKKKKTYYAAIKEFQEHKRRSHESVSFLNQRTTITTNGKNLEKFQKSD